MPTYMKHVDHGYHIVYNDTDRASHEAIGWKVVDMKAEKAARQAAVIQAALDADAERSRLEIKPPDTVPVATPPPAVFPRRGRPPKGR